LKGANESGLRVSHFSPKHSWPSSYLMLTALQAMISQHSSWFLFVFFEFFLVMNFNLNNLFLFFVRVTFSFWWIRGHNLGLVACVCA
jgi:hypothetical protein